MHERARISIYLYAVADHLRDLIREIRLQDELSLLSAFLIKNVTEEWHFGLLKIEILGTVLVLAD